MSELVTANASVIAAAISALVAFGVALITSRRSFSIEIDKLRLGVQQKLLEQLVAARLVVYPALYSLLSELAKVDYKRPLAIEQLTDLSEKVNAWDSQHAILLGPDTTNICYSFRASLKKVLRTTTTGVAAADEEVAELFDNAEQLELALRSDIGVYGVELPPARDGLRMPRILGY